MQQEQLRLLAYYQAELSSLERKSGMREPNDQFESIKTVMELLRYADKDRAGSSQDRYRVPPAGVDWSDLADSTVMSSPPPEPPAVTPQCENPKAFTR